MKTFFFPYRIICHSTLFISVTALFFSLCFSRFDWHGQYIFSGKCFLRNMLLISSQTFINTGFFQWKHFFFRTVLSVIPPFLFQWRLYFFPFVSQDLIDMVNTYFRGSVFWGTRFLLALINTGFFQRKHFFYIVWLTLISMHYVWHSCYILIWIFCTFVNIK